MKPFGRKLSIAFGLLVTMMCTIWIGEAPVGSCPHWVTLAMVSFLTWWMGYSSAELLEAGRSLKYLYQSKRHLADADAAHRRVRQAHEAHFRTIEVLRMIERDRDFARATEYLKSIQDEAN